jgi:Septum formation
MSTEATGDGEPPAVDAAGLDEDSEPAKPTAALRGEAAGAGESTEAMQNAAASEPNAGDEFGETSELESGETDESGESEEDESEEDESEEDESEEDESEEDESEEDESEEDYEDYADDELIEGDLALEYDEPLEYDEDYEGDESDEIPQPRRARRWPRVLLAFGFLILGAAIVGGAIAIVGSVTHGFKKPVKITYKKSPVFSLKTGDCFDPRGQSYTLVSCDSPHVAEVFATFTLTGTKWPGDAAVQAAASSGCASRLTEYLNPQLAISVSSTYVYPDSVAWQAGTRTVICEVRASSGQLTGSVRGASATAG